MKRATRETWAKRIERWRESGKSVDAYAAEAGLNARSLSWWKWKLGTAGAARSKQRASTVRSAALAKPTTISPVTFIEMTAAVATEPLEMVLPSSIRINVRPGFDDRTLGRLLDVLERRS